MASLVSCHECGLEQRAPGLPAGGHVRCGRCGASLYRRTAGGAERGLALAVTAAIVFLIANVSPIATLDARGDRTSTTILGLAASLQGEHLALLAALVVAIAVLMPALQISFAIHLLAAIRRSPGPRFKLALRLFEYVRRWSMSEVLFVGSVVALARLGGVAHVEFGWGLWALLALVALEATLPTPGDVRAASGIVDLPSPPGTT